MSYFLSHLEWAEVFRLDNFCAVVHKWKSSGLSPVLRTGEILMHLLIARTLIFFVNNCLILSCTKKWRTILHVPQFVSCCSGSESGSYIVLDQSKVAEIINRGASSSINLRTTVPFIIVTKFITFFLFLS